MTVGLLPNDGSTRSELRFNLEGNEVHFGLS